MIHVNKDETARWYDQRGTDRGGCCGAERLSLGSSARPLPLRPCSAAAAAMDPTDPPTVASGGAQAPMPTVTPPLSLDAFTLPPSVLDPDGPTSAMPGPDRDDGAADVTLDERNPYFPYGAPRSGCGQPETMADTLCMGPGSWGCARGRYRMEKQMENVRAPTRAVQAGPAAANLKRPRCARLRFCRKISSRW